MGIVEHKGRKQAEGYMLSHVTTKGTLLNF
jgi:hypothetical protein